MLTNKSKRLALWLLCSIFFHINIFAQEKQEEQEEQEIIEHYGDRYVINVGAMHPDKEMTLMDVLQTCPELLSPNGKRLAADYEIWVDNVTLPMDDETLLEAWKASEIEQVEVYLYSAVATGGAGRGGTINLYLKEQEAGTTTGKLMLEGSTRGNGKAYTDIISRTGNVTLRGYALSNLEHVKGSLTDYDRFSSRQGIENVHLNLDWNISDNDNLKVKLFQAFVDSKHKISDDEGTSLTIPETLRNWYGVASYTRTLNAQGATLLSELGADYLNSSMESSKIQDCYTYFFSEASLPLLNNDLSILAGWEIDYYNSWVRDDDRHQTMFNDLYLQLEYAKGPWVFSLGDRFRMINFWHRTYSTADGSLWNKSRTEHSYLASAGYKAGRHFMQGLFSSDYLTPTIYDFYAGYDEEMRRRTYLTDMSTNKFYSAEIRYTYQNPGLIVSGSLLHTWTHNAPVYEERYTGVRASVTWRKGCFRLTAGADYFHGYASETDGDFERHDNFFHLRLLPTLLLKGGWRISSKLLYNSRRYLPMEIHPHFYASVKVNKDLGRHCTLSAEMHDMAGTPRISLLEIGSSYDSRALTLGFSYRF